MLNCIQLLAYLLAEKFYCLITCVLLVFQKHAA